ncbi:MAG: lactonase family protein [Verrucomicrobiota bacterium]
MIAQPLTKLVVICSFWLIAFAQGESLYVAGKGGIYAFQLDDSDGTLSPAKLVAAVSAPSYLAFHPEQPFLYCTNNDGDKKTKSSSHLLSFLVTEEELIELSSVETGGTTSAFVEVDKRGRFAFVANYRWGSIAGFQLEPDGRIGLPTVFVQHEGASTHPTRQTEPHPHAVRMSPDNRFAYVPDLGTDDVFIYQVNHFDGSLSSAIEPWSKAGQGSGPRHMDFHPRVDVAYVINELDSTVSVFTRNPDLGALVASQTLSTLPQGYDGPNACAHIQVHPNGKWVYGSNRGHNSIVVYETTSNGFLSWVDQHKTGSAPRHFAISPSGNWLIAGNKGDSTLTVFRINPRTGQLVSTEETPTPVPSPSCLAFSPSH